MENSEGFNDPLSDIDPVMEQAFTVDDSENDTVETAVDIPDDTFEPSEPMIETHPVEDDLVMEDDDDEAISDIQFPSLSNEDTGRKVEMDVFSNIPVNLSVELGRSQISLKEVFELTEGSIIELERLVGEPLDLVVNGQIIAQGEVVAIDNNYGLRITHVVANAGV